MHRSFCFLTFAALVMLAGCATAPPAAPVAAIAPAAPSAPAAKPASTKPARTAAQIKMDELLDDAGASAVFKKHAPELASNSQITMARGMTLADVAGYAEAGLTPARVQAIVDDINKL